MRCARLRAHVLWNSHRSIILIGIINTRLQEYLLRAADSFVDGGGNVCNDCCGMSHTRVCVFVSDTVVCVCVPRPRPTRAPPPELPTMLADARSGRLISLI